MIYLIDPKGVVDNKGCMGLFIPLYGVPTCYEVCKNACPIL